MNNYLLQLLREVKTIIIPGLGALTLTNEVTGEMMFMPYLKYDDGTLAKHISEKEGMDVNDAKIMIAKFVREVQAELDKGHSYDMYLFGRFKKVDGDVAFEQWGNDVTETLTEKPMPEAPQVPVIEETAPIAEAPVEEAIAASFVAAEITPEQETVPEAAVTEEEMTPEEAPSDAIVQIQEESVIAAYVAAEVTPEEHLTPAEAVVPAVEEPKTTSPVEEESKVVAEEKPVLIKAEEPVAPKADQTLVKTEEPSPLPPKGQPKKELSPKEKLAAKDARKKKEPKPAAKAPAGKAQPKKKRRVLGYILWGFVVLLLGGATYVAVNFNTLKQDFPILADLAGDNNDDALGQQELEKANAQAEANLQDSLKAAEAEKEQQEEQETAIAAPEMSAEPEPTPTPTPTPTPKPEKTVYKPKPATTTPKPKPRPKPVTSSSGGGNIGSMDASKPYHVVAGSFGSEANAKRFARQLIAQGQSSVAVGESSGMYRVSIGSFATKDEAVQAHSTLKGSVPQAWVYKWP